jgi:hypothetical protein
MATKEVDKRLIDDLVFYYEEKKRLTNKNFKYRDTPADRSYFQEAGELCEAHELDPATYVQLMYDRMETKKEFFSPKCLQGVKAKYFLEEHKNNFDSWKIEITNASLDVSALWRYQHELATLYIRRGESVESVLIDSSLKFFAWFRILATPNRVPAIIDKYKNIAKKEMTSKIIEFAKSENLDLDRLL